jgi:hypothetical protein
MVEAICVDYDLKHIRSVRLALLEQQGSVIIMDIVFVIHVVLLAILVLGAPSMVEVKKVISMTPIRRLS